MLKEKLNPEFSNQKSFYGKAIVLRSNDELQLQSYNTIVCGTKEMENSLSTGTDIQLQP